MMVRKRVGLPRMIFHVVNRGARKISIFTDDQDRELFVRLMGKFALQYGVDVLSWVLMPNHYHLEVASEGTPLTLMMRSLDGTYSRMFNERHEMTGCLFQGPFRSFSVSDRDLEGALYVSRYIHANSLDLGVLPEEYPWSSARSYIGVAPIPEWLKPMGLLDEVGGPQGYLDYLRRVPPRRQKAGKRPMENFLADYLRHLEERLTDRQPLLAPLLGRIPFRTLVCWAAIRLHGIPAQEVARYFGYAGVRTVHSVVWRFESRLAEDPVLAAAVKC